MKLQIKNKFNNSIIYECEGGNLKDAVIKAIEENADLHYADLRHADLRHVDLITFQFQRHHAFYTFDGTLRIGCIVLPISEWVDTFEQIGLHEQYTDEQIDMYGHFINICYKHFLNNT